MSGSGNNVSRTVSLQLGMLENGNSVSRGDKGLIAIAHLALYSRMKSSGFTRGGRLSSNNGPTMKRPVPNQEQDASDQVVE